LATPIRAVAKSGVEAAPGERQIARASHGILEIAPTSVGAGEPRKDGLADGTIPSSVAIIAIVLIEWAIGDR
jgi:hypothetical protein